MSSSVAQYKQQISDSLLPASVSLREPMGAGEMLAAGAARLLEVGDYSRTQRQRLHNLSRPCAIAAANRSGLATWLELAPHATPGASLWLLELGRIEVIARSGWRLPVPDLAHEAEEDSNRDGNVTGGRLRENRTRSRLYDFDEAMLVQALASRIVADSEAAELRTRSSIMLASR